ncbi:MAG: radical SAM protein [Methanothrix sp.]|uniref:radical SAM/SPASM domain-containing protein n=1 Tax=Methanothrix sp. TaxID=90426 RepID=UPI0025DED3CB|nr:radical SAM protein [Methanothrix sp.]MCQ8904037.1 radical SAM protein [Methanothrix sp.]
MRYTLCDTPLLKATASVDSGRISIRADGLLSKVPAISSAISTIDGNIPAFAGESLYISTWLPPVPSRAFDRFVRSQILASIGRRTPDQITISITEECPNRCRHCALPDTGAHLRLEPDDVKRIIDQALDLGSTIIIFDGGEPSLYRELPELVSYVDDRAVTTIFTSGAGFTESLARQLRNAGLQAVNVSLDSPVEDEHDSMRGRRGVYRDAMNAIKHALRAGLLVDIYVVLRHDNIAHLQRFHDLARKAGAHELTFFEVVPTGRCTGSEDIVLDASDLSALEMFVSNAPPPRIFSVPAALKRFGCFAGRSWMHVTPSGEVYPCACYPKSYGNALGESLARIWKRMSDFPYKGINTCPMRSKGPSKNL